MASNGFVDLTSLSFVLQHYLPLPNDLLQCEQRKRQKAVTVSVRKMPCTGYTNLPCGSSEECLSLPYQVYSDTNVVVPPSIPSVPDLDIVEVPKHGLVITGSLEEANIPNRFDYKSIFRMRTFSETHAGYTVLEVVYNQNNCDCHAKLFKRNNLNHDGEIPADILTLDLKDGGTIQCLASGARIPYKLAKGRTQGPAFTITTSSGKWGSMDTDHVHALSCPEWPPMANDWLSRDRHSNWPLPTMVETIRKSGCLLVPVGHHTSHLPDYEWRLSFSQAEVILAQSLTYVQRKCYLIVKTFLKTALREPTVLSTYHLKTLMFWTCESKAQHLWQESNMADNVLDLLESLRKCLTNRNIPHYFIPEHNLIDHIDSVSIEMIKDKVENVRANICDQLVESFITLMPCCVKMKTLICAKVIFTEALKMCQIRNTFTPKGRAHFLEQLGQYYFCLLRNGLFADKLHDSMKYSERLEEGKSCFSGINDGRPPFNFQLDMALKLSPDPQTAFNYVISSTERITSQYDMYDEPSLEEARNQIVRLHFACMPKLKDDPEPIKQQVFGPFKTQQIEQLAKNKSNPHSLAILADILEQLGDTEEALENVDKGLDLLHRHRPQAAEFVSSEKDKNVDTCSNETISAAKTQESVSLESNTAGQKDQQFSAEMETSGYDSSNAGTVKTGGIFSDFNTMLFYKVHAKGLDENLANAISGLSDKEPISMPTEVFLLYIKCKCFVKQGNGKSAECVKLDILKMIEERYQHISNEEKKIIEQICKLNPESCE